MAAINSTRPVETGPTLLHAIPAYKRAGNLRAARRESENPVSLDDVQGRVSRRVSQPEVPRRYKELSDLINPNESSLGLEKVKKSKEYA